MYNLGYLNVSSKNLRRKFQRRALENTEMLESVVRSSAMH